MAASKCYCLPSHPSALVPDPLSICESYDSMEVAKWLMVSRLVGKGSITNFEELEDVITSFKPDVQFDTLKVVVDRRDPVHFFSTVVPAICTMMLQMPMLFPTGELPVLTPGEDTSVTFTREQVSCLLSHMFFCTLEPPSWSQYWANFDIWYNSNSPPVKAYLEVLLTYFTQLAEGRQSGADTPPGLVTFHRRVLTSPPDWKSSTSKLTEDLLTPSYNLEPPSEADAEVDFANKDIGFGVSGSQEEVFLAMSPETCITMLIAPPVCDNETLTIQGARRVGKYEGIGRKVRFVGPWTETRDWTNRFIIAMDALELDLRNSEDQIMELYPETLCRELNKAYCGFSPLHGKPFTLVSTGHWGCGAFGGHKYAKALIQLMAASEAKTKLVFHDIQQAGPLQELDFLPQLLQFLVFLSKRGVAVGKLFSTLLEVGKLQCQGHRDSSSDLLKLLTQKLEVCRVSE